MRVVINHKTGSRRGSRETFERESVLIGRGGPNDVALDPFRDPTVSALHAEIRFEEDGYTLYDMGSLNGTYLNGTVVRRARLENGDEIGLGQKGPKLAVMIDGDGPPPSGGSSANRPRTSSGKTSLEVELPQIEEAIVSRNPLLYLILAVAGISLLGFLWWWISGR